MCPVRNDAESGDQHQLATDVQVIDSADHEDPARTGPNPSTWPTAGPTAQQARAMQLRQNIQRVTILTDQRNKMLHALRHDLVLVQAQAPDGKPDGESSIPDDAARSFRHLIALGLETPEAAAAIDQQHPEGIRDLRHLRRQSRLGHVARTGRAAEVIPTHPASAGLRACRSRCGSPASYDWHDSVVSALIFGDGAKAGCPNFNNQEFDR